MGSYRNGLVNVTVARSSFRQRRQLHEFLRNGVLTCTEPKVSQLPEYTMESKRRNNPLNWDYPSCVYRHMQAVLACACWVKSGQKKCSCTSHIHGVQPVGYQSHALKRLGSGNDTVCTIMIHYAPSRTHSQNVGGYLPQCDGAFSGTYWAISKTLVSRKGHPQIWEGPISYHTFVQ